MRLKMVAADRTLKRGKVKVLESKISSNQNTQKRGKAPLADIFFQKLFGKRRACQK
jgi:hypothetical protein